MLALPAPPLITLFRKSGIVWKFYDLGCLYDATRFCLFPPLPFGERWRLEGRGADSKLFRNGGGLPADSSGNQAAYPPNTPGFERHGSGTICGKSKSGGTAMGPDCLSLAKNMP